MIQNKTTYSVVGIGEVLWDIFQDRRHVGGAPANFAIHAKQLGDEATLISRVGDDGMGNELLRTLKGYGLSNDYIQIDRKKGTGTVLVSLDIKGVPSFHCSTDISFDYLEYSSTLKSLASAADAVLFSSLGQRSMRSQKTILQFASAARNAVRIYDINTPKNELELSKTLPASLELADIVKMNATALDLLKRALRRDGDRIDNFVRFLIEKYNLKMVAVTFGEKGCRLFTEKDSCRMEGYKVSVVDTTGAGDAFAAGLTHKYLRGAELIEIAEYANLLGAYVCTQEGATPRFRLNEIDSFRRSL